MKRIVSTLAWKKTYLEIIDQTQLPLREKYLRLKTIDDVWGAIRFLKIRGAPAIGLAAAYGLLLAAKQFRGKPEEFIQYLSKKTLYLRECRPTARNLFYGLERVLKTAENSGDVLTAISRMERECARLVKEDLICSHRIGTHGLALIKNGMRILTHCNAGALATAGGGTALALFYAAKSAGREILVYVDETRPVLQGARLTCWELMKAEISHILICDNMAGYLMAQKKVDAVVVGADRICRNGDTANKIGTYPLAVLARYHRIPFYIAAPISTIDFSLENGGQIPIEERAAREIIQCGNSAIAPKSTRVYNPSFDVTPGTLITSFITEKGVLSLSEFKTFVRAHKTRR
jgi:methylthioribose-1-phosphate isomerase